MDDQTCRRLQLQLYLQLQQQQQQQQQQQHLPQQILSAGTIPNPPPPLFVGNNAAVSAAATAPTNAIFVFVPQVQQAHAPLIPAAGFPSTTVPLHVFSNNQYQSAVGSVFQHQQPLYNNIPLLLAAAAPATTTARGIISPGPSPQEQINSSTINTPFVPNFNSSITAQQRTGTTEETPPPAASWQELVMKEIAKDGTTSTGGTATTAATFKPDVNKVKNETNSRQPPSRRRKKKDPDLPRRPLNTYNIFFQMERARIIGEVSENDDDNKSNVAAAAAAAAASSSSSQPPSKKQRKKAHHKISFEGLAKTVAARWKNLTKEQKSVYKRLAEEERNKYQQNLNEYTARKFKEEEAARQKKQRLKDDKKYR